MKIKELARGLRFPEGPIAMNDGSVVLVEIAAGKLTRVDTEGKVSTLADLGGGPNGAAIGPDGACYVCNNGGFAWVEDKQNGILRPHGPSADYVRGSIQRVDLETGRFETLYDACEGRPLLGPNDIVFDTDGGFWFTDLGKTRDGSRERDLGSVYYARADGSAIKEVAFPVFAPNGIGLSPDGKTLYVAETESARLWGYTIAGPGELSKEGWPSPHGGRLLAACGDHEFQRFDSLAVDGDGNINVATLNRGGITVVPPQGKQSEHIAFDDPFTTNICFGGADLRTAFITLSGTGRLVAAEWPRAGLKLNYTA